MRSSEILKLKFGFNPFMLNRTATENKIKIQQVIEYRRSSLTKVNRNFEVINQRRSKDDDRFYRAIGPVIQFVQLFSFFPVQNVMSDDVNDLEFRWMSLLTARSVLCLMLVVFDFGLFSFTFQHKEFSLDEFNICISFVLVIAAHYLFFRTGMRWKNIMRQWASVEEIYLYSPFKKPKYSLRFKIRMISCVFLLGAFAENGLFVGQLFFYGLMRQEVCGFNENIAEFMFIHVKRYFHRHIGYHNLIAILAELLNISMTLIRNFMNLILILMSIGISDRFKQLGDRIESMRGTNVPEIFWTDCRLQYKKLADLVCTINDNFGLMVLLACLNNVYFLCIQLYYSLRFDSEFIIDRLYYNGSFVFLMFSLLAVLLSAARIHSMSKQPLSVLRCLPPDAWNSEAERFMFQVQYERVSLSGCNIFVISKGLVLALASTIITYEMAAMDNFKFSASLSKATICNKI